QIGVACAIEGLDEQSADDEQHNRGGDLRDDQQAAKSSALGTLSLAAGLEQRIDIGAPRIERRRQPGDHAGGERDGNRRADDAPLAMFALVMQRRSPASSASTAAAT